VALGQKVVLCSPCTLFSVLAIVRQAVEQTQLQRRSDDILRVLAGFEQQWGLFAEALDRVGRQLDTVRRGWDDLAGPRRRQLDRELERVDDLRRRRDPLVAPAADEGPAVGEAAAVVEGDGGPTGGPAGEPAGGPTGDGPDDGAGGEAGGGVDGAGTGRPAGWPVPTRA